MKFEKFVKRCGVYGEVVAVANEKWLICDGVGMLIPSGAKVIIGGENESLFTARINAIGNISEIDLLTLTGAEMSTPDGGAKDIIRVFDTAFGNRIKISNADYGLLEKSDRIGFCEIQSDDDVTMSYMVIYNYDDEAIGYITGLTE